MLPTYQNEPTLDFSRPENQHALRAGLDKVRAQLGRTYPLVIDGREIALADTFPSINPARPSEVIGHFANGNASHADDAIASSAAAFKTWRFVSVEERARYLLRAAANMRRRRHEFDAMMVYEVGKSWAEAEADTAESIDFMEYYARQALRMTDSSDLLMPFPAEQLSLYYLPMGVVAVIPPWNFPNAICAGMIAAALVTGNTVVAKPAEQSPAIAYMICQLFWEAGLPKGVLNFLTGPGEVVGARMVEHPETRIVSFTGSRAVGVQIYEQAAKVRPGQKWLKRMVLEMGGKDAILVDETATLEAAAQGIVASAFGFQGQKCSACSRAIIVDEVYEQVAERVVALTNSLHMGSTDKDYQVDIGPVIDEDSLNRLQRYIDIGNSEGELLAGGKVTKPEDGYFVEPTVFGEVGPDSRVAQEEIFGPLLALVRASSFDHAIEIANNTEYGLTGAVFTNSRERIEQARREFHVGNMYINRKCTGAMVGVHPFGGFNMSGTDSKAGGPDYLLLFTQAQSVAERL